MFGFIVVYTYIRFERKCMELFEQFISLSRSAAQILGCASPAIKKLAPHKHKTESGGCAVFRFDGFQFNVFFIEQGVRRYYDNTLFATACFDRCDWLPFSIYDIIAAVKPDDFEPCVFTQLDTAEKLSLYYAAVTEKLAELAPLLNEACNDGVVINKIIAAQRDAVGNYIGQPLDLLDFSVPSVARLVNALISRYIDDQNEESLFGGQGEFYAGGGKKSLKALKRIRRKTQYQQNLIAYIEAGGEVHGSPYIYDGRMRDTTKKRILFFGLTVVLTLVFSAAAALICYLCRPLFFENAVYIFGFKESLVTLPVFNCAAGACAAYAIAQGYENRVRQKKNVAAAVRSKAQKSTFKAFTLMSEVLVIVGCLVSMYSQCVFYENKVAYNDAFFPISHYAVEYSAIDRAVIKKGYEKDDKISDDPHIELIMKSGDIADLYNSTFLTYGEFEKTAAEILAKKGISIEKE